MGFSKRFFVWATIFLFSFACAALAENKTQKEQTPYLYSLSVSGRGKYIVFDVINPQVELGKNLLILNLKNGEKTVFQRSEINSPSPWSPVDDNYLIVFCTRDFGDTIPPNVPDIPVKKKILGEPTFNKYLVNFENKKMFLLSSDNIGYSAWSPDGKKIYLADNEKGLVSIKLSTLFETKNSFPSQSEIYKPKFPAQVGLIIPLPAGKRIFITIFAPSTEFIVSVVKMLGFYCLDLSTKKLTEINIPNVDALGPLDVTFLDDKTCFMLSSEVLPFPGVSILKEGAYLDEKGMSATPDLTKEYSKYLRIRSLYRINIDDISFERLFSFSSKLSEENPQMSLSQNGIIALAINGNISLFNYKDKSMTVLTSSDQADAEPVYNAATNALFFIRDGKQIIRKSLDDFSEKIVYELPELDETPKLKENPTPPEPDFSMYRIPREDMEQFAQLINNQRKEIQKYFDDFGAPPVSLDELQQAGYKVYEPYKNYLWEYKVREKGFSITLVPDFSKTGQ